MESREGMSSVVTVVAPEAPSDHNVARKTENLALVPTTTPMAPSPVNAGLTGSAEKKKRGRPRKYGPDGPRAKALSLLPISASAPPTSGNFWVEKESVRWPVSSEKKQKKKVKAESSVKSSESAKETSKLYFSWIDDWVSCATGASFLPHLINVDAGEDVSMKLISFSQQGPRAICIISAVGIISNVTLRQPNSSGGTLTYEGRFEILSLSGSFTPTEFGRSQSRTGGMSISLISPDGRVVGGLLAGQLIAASPVQVVVCSFLPSNHHEVKPKKHKTEAKLITNATGYAAIPHTSNIERISSDKQYLNSSVTANPTTVSSSSAQTENGAPYHQRMIQGSLLQTPT